VGGLRGIKRMEFPLLVRKKAFVRCCRDGVPHCAGCGIEINARIGIIYGHVVSAGLGSEPMLDEAGGTLTATLPATARYDHGLLTGHWSDLPVGSFSESGTNISTTVLTMRNRGSA
jgi:hypothetical protein